MNLATRGIPILMLTVEETDQAEIVGLDSGADGFVSKSVDPDILVLRIRTLLSQGTHSTAALKSTDASFRNARLLTIDDSEVFQEYLAEHLSREGYQLERSIGSTEGLSRLQTGVLRLCLG